MSKKIIGTVLIIILMSTVLIFLYITLNPSTPKIEKHTFSGTSNNWIITFKTEISDNNAWSDYIVEYIGEEPAPHKFDYKLKSDWLNYSTKDMQFNHPTENIVSGNSECTGPPVNNVRCPVIIKEDANLEGIIEWNGKSETIVLEKK